MPEEEISKEEFLMKNLDLSKSALSPEGKERLKQIILNHKDAIVGPDGVIGTYKGPVMHRIDLIDPTKFMSDRPRRVPPALEEVM